MFRWLLLLVLVLFALVGGAYLAAGSGAPPALTITRPDKVVGQAGTLEVTAAAPGAKFTILDISAEQNGKTYPLFALKGAESATITQVDPNTLRVSRPFGKVSVPDLMPGAVRITVTASRKSFLNLRTLSSTATKDVQVRLEPPRVAVVSTHHYINLGGSEMVVYRATPADVKSGVRVGNIEYPGFPAAGAGVTGADPSLKVAFFALLYDQDLSTPIEVFAQDDAGNEAKASFMDNAFPKPFKKSNIQIDDRFLDRVVPEIIAHSPELKIAPPAPGDATVQAFLVINGKLRQMNADEIAAIATRKTSAQRLWEGPFVQLGNSQVEAAFADHRTYFYNGKEIDRQVHLGFDLAVTSHVPVVAAAAGTVLNAKWLGIYGNCVIIDHGMGVASLYGHLSSFDVKEGDTVTKGQKIGQSGMTGLAGGDHLHFTMLVGGHMVNPVEWWDAHWVQDRVDRKLVDSQGAR